MSCNPAGGNSLIRTGLASEKRRGPKGGGLAQKKKNLVEGWAKERGKEWRGGGGEGEIQTGGAGEDLKEKKTKVFTRGRLFEGKRKKEVQRKANIRKRKKLSEV